MTKRLNDFVNKWNGEYCEVTGSANALYQCVDSVNAYIRDVLGFPIIEWTDAKDFPSKAGDLYDWIPNTLTAIPQEGDLIVWKTNHIAICISATQTRFMSFDQNYPLGSPCHTQGHTYANVDGWLRKKVINQDEEMITDQTKIPQIIDKNGNPMEVQAIKSTIADLTRDIKQFKETIAKLEVQPKKDAVTIKNLKGDVLQLGGKIEQLEKDVKQIKKYDYRDKKVTELFILALSKLIGGGENNG